MADALTHEHTFLADPVCSPDSMWSSDRTALPPLVRSGLKDQSGEVIQTETGRKRGSLSFMMLLSPVRKMLCFCSSIRTNVASKCCWHLCLLPCCCWVFVFFLHFSSSFPFPYLIPVKVLSGNFYLALFVSSLLVLFPFYKTHDKISLTLFPTWCFFFLFVRRCSIRLLVSLCLTSSVSVSLLVFFWKITRSGAVRVHVFCAGCTDWMGWLRWAGFLCGPPANFMIYSAKGRGARPPVTTERELHVGLMISPQKCLLWLGLHGAQSPPTGWMVEREEGLKRELGWPAWVNTIAYHYTFARRGLWGRRGWTGSYIRPSYSKCFKCFLSLNKCFLISECVVFLLFSFLRSYPLSPESRSQWEISEASLKCGHRGWCNQAFMDRERGWNNGMGWWWRGIFGTFFSAGLLAREGDCWGLGSGCYAWCCFSQCLFGYESPRTGWCHPEGFVNILDKGTKSQGWA